VRLAESWWSISLGMMAEIAGAYLLIVLLIVLWIVIGIVNHTNFLTTLVTSLEKRPV
jgi:hypothetical protein